MARSSNPYTIVFGKSPLQLISRSAQSAEVVDSFCEDPPTQQVYMITGLRGSGKTVFMSEIAKEFGRREDWIVVELNPEQNLLESLAAKLTSKDQLSRFFESARINLSFLGFGIEISGVAPIRDLETAVGKMMETLRKHEKRLLITIDEVTNTQQMRIFASAFQIYIRQDLPVFLLMTGLYDHIDALQNTSTLTFLYRAPKIDMKALNITSIAENYRKNLEIDRDYALRMAKLTKGYSFAFQVLGYFGWKKRPVIEEIYEDYRQYLEDYVYDKIWSELSAADKRVAYGIAMSENGKIARIREILQMDTNHFNPYRQRLKKKGLITGDRGYAQFVLPLFDQYVKDHYEEDLYM